MAAAALIEEEAGGNPAPAARLRLIAVGRTCTRRTTSTLREYVQTLVREYVQVRLVASTTCVRS